MGQKPSESAASAQPKAYFDFSDGLYCWGRVCGVSHARGLGLGGEREFGWRQRLRAPLGRQVPVQYQRPSENTVSA
ncbi:hypothetical protein HMPREF9123_0606 [Neisseria bacilliformis ATCC BAA-1200]|uniref:Uncharacterized protein n=1 Tax=Neisseria bacilliformis ATCC BAA-1200 TaxID=888742 RepID=F2BA52_9NEIS|nr:hypothetical protein HMPREF9123_0606 [Neisseria bacilliformis ATCC BAA-1200]